MIGVCDVDEERAKEQADLHGVKAFTSVEDLVKEPGVDAIDVVTSGSHRDPAVMAAEAGKHVLVENPFANTVEEADDMIAASEKSGVVMMYAQTHRFYWAYVKAKELIDSSEIGDPISIVFTYFLQRLRKERALEPSPGPGWRLLRLRGDPLHRRDAMANGQRDRDGQRGGDEPARRGWRRRRQRYRWLYVRERCLRRDTPWDRRPGRRAIRLEAGRDQGNARRDRHRGATAGEGATGRPIALREGHDGFLIEFQEFLDSITEDRPLARTAYDGRATIAAAQAVIRSYEERCAGAGVAPERTETL